MRPVVACVFALASCGRVSFTPRDDGATASPDASTQLDPALVLWLAFEDDPADGTLDSSGAGLHFPCFTQCPVMTSGRHGMAADFNGMGPSFARVVPTLPRDDYTWEAWVRPSSVQPFAGLLSVHGEVGLRPGGLELAMINGVYTHWIHNSLLDSTTAVPVGAWTHLAVVRSAGAIGLYVDGSVVRLFADTESLDFASCELLVGVDSDSGCVGSLNGYYDGALDEVRIYARALSTAEVQADASSATPL